MSHYPLMFSRIILNRVRQKNVNTSTCGNESFWRALSRVSAAKYSLKNVSPGIKEELLSVAECRCTRACIHAFPQFCRQNLNSDFTDSALGSAEKSPLPYGNFQLRDSTVQSILRHPRYGPKSPLANNSYTYLKFGLPRVLPPSSRNRDGSSGYDSSEEGRRVSHAGTRTNHGRRAKSLNEDILLLFQRYQIYLPNSIFPGYTRRKIK